MHTVVSILSNTIVLHTLVILAAVLLIIGLFKFFIKTVWHLIYWCCFIVILLVIGAWLGRLFWH